MSKTLIIVESPNKCPTIRKLVGGGYDVQTSVGHIREISADCPPLTPENKFQPTFSVFRDKGKVVKNLKEAAKECKEVLIATDPDREGEAIAWHIYDIFDKTTKAKCRRIVFNEISKTAILSAIAHPRDIDYNLVSAQKARQVLDRLIGFTVSPVLWQQVASKTSAGRVQSVALKIICERQLEIDAFKPVKYWHIDAKLKAAKGEIIARLQTDGYDNRIVDSKTADSTTAKLKASTYKLKDCRKNTKSLAPNPPFDTSSLQSACSSLFGWDLTKTMKLAQKLYETSYVSYIRTDSYSISKDALDAVHSLISSKYGSDALFPRTFHKKSGASAQEAHECIRPTHLENTGGELGDELLKLYQLIRARFISCQMADAKISTVEYVVEASCKETLIATGKTVLSEGWLKEYSKYLKTKEVLLPAIEIGEALKLLGIRAEAKETQPPDRYNDGSLVKKLESEGIGRPSTHANILKTLIDRLYVVRDGRTLDPTELGMKVYKFLNTTYSDFFMDIKYTSTVNDDLDLIADGKSEFLTVVTSVYEKLQAKQMKIAGTSKLPVCTKCHRGNITERDGKWGKWYSCNQFPACKTVFIKNKDGTFTEKT